jgi:secondary thiamine-phosphate synthase enzyme
MNMDEITVKTSSHTQIIDITSKVNEILAKTGIKEGICTVFTPHTTAGITINENADPDVPRDIIKEMEKVVPLNDGYAHIEGNSAAHIKSSLFGCSETVIIRNGTLMLGTWQSVFFCEFDGPRNRKVWVEIIGK